MEHGCKVQGLRTKEGFQEFIFVTSRSNTDRNFGPRVKAEISAIEVSKIAVSRVEYLRYCKSIERHIESAPFYI